ncbi:ABC transporter ATP-binding protein [Desulfurobacterium atlanticum]|uniref:Amino acid/amide ABC transporter ATP-binding protein 2, HAAT family n=1 Tax=Desulfurobacterium atlanticum TaxID=240169 RepID=A0A238Y1R7_9BACT|nr:ABC transporter ATP-binding protein [Desulfurobacterium atlanticum]SNR64930.1 amino acid/amide ABC transporter ATP-binding protein 2, HAAT family [Desulfurobacterium atlanticum]
MSEKDTVLEIIDLHAGYDDVQVLWGVNLKVKRHTLTTIIGANGAGKTTTLKAICGLLKNVTGKVVLNGEDISRIPTHERVDKGLVMVPEGRWLFPEMTVLENLRMGAYPKHARDKREETLEWVYTLFPRLKERANQKAGTLSGGEQQMVAIGRGLMSRPEVLILDEPSLGLAPNLVLDIFKIIQELKEEGLTVLLVEQNVHLGLAISDYAYVMEHGKIVMEGTGQELENDPKVKEAYLGI